MEAPTTALLSEQLDELRNTPLANVPPDDARAVLLHVLSGEHEVEVALFGSSV